MLDLLSDILALLIVAGLGYNSFIRVRNIYRDTKANEQKRPSDRNN